MKQMLVAIIVLIAVAASSGFAGVWVLFGLGWALIESAVFAVAVAALLTRGLRVNGE